MILDSGNWAEWRPVVYLDGVDVSARMTGRISISAAEDSARLANLSLRPANASELAAYIGQLVQIDVVLSRGVITETYRMFTGQVEDKTFDPFGRIATLSCRDGFQQRRVGGTSAAEVEALFPAGKIFPSPALLPWSDTDPDPGGYFDGILSTAMGAVAYDANSNFNFIPWDIGVPVVTFGPGDICDGSMLVRDIRYSEVPSVIDAKLHVRAHRLHNAETSVGWLRLDRYSQIIHGLPVLSKSMAQSAIDGLSGWHVKGEIGMYEPTPGIEQVEVGGNIVHYGTSTQEAAVTCDSLSAVIYRRWYQEIEVVYSVSYHVGGLADPQALHGNISSDFDASAWESSPRNAPSSGLFTRYNGGPLIEPTGYEALPTPWPPENSSMDYYGTLTAAAIEEAFNHLSAKALRQAAQAKRRRTVSFARPIDPRFDLGAVMQVLAYGVEATGQLVSIEYSLDIDTGDAESVFTLAVPNATGSAMSFSTVLVPPNDTITHNLWPIDASNHIGQIQSTPDDPQESSLVGFLMNAANWSPEYSAVKPAYITQFRLIAPEIAANYRDPLVINVDAAGDYAIATGSLAISF